MKPSAFPVRVLRAGWWRTVEVADLEPGEIGYAIDWPPERIMVKMAIA